MAIDKMLFAETDKLAYANKAFLPVRIPVSHWQLRHYISTPEPDHLYYASGHDIFCLNTATKKRRLVATLPFEARCTASGYGYVCVGGDVDGQNFAAIKLDGATGARMRGVDDPLHVSPLSGGAQQYVGESDGAAAAAAAAAAGVRRGVNVKVERIGEEIVNSISIHRIHDEAAHLDDIVAVLTNNDKTVRLYSLPANLETAVLDLVFPINHATLSPDGRYLVAVGDHNQAFFFQRHLQATPPQIPKPHNRLNSSNLEWKLTNVVDLFVNVPDGSRGYFTTTWSPNGRLVAVGSEGGYITVFDIDMLLDPEIEDSEAAVAIVPGSRPDFLQPHPGAIRSMVFAPDPWDLLIWAEDQGRICIGDLRTGLRSRQTVSLDPKDSTLARMTYEDLPVPNEDSRMGGTADDDLDMTGGHQNRHSSTRDSDVNFATEYIEARRRQRVQRPEFAALRAQMARADRSSSPLAADMPPGLTAREQQILESLRTTRQREEARVAGGGTPANITYTSSELFRDDLAARAGLAPLGVPQRRRSVTDLLNMIQDPLAPFPELSRTNALGQRPPSAHGTDESNTLPTLSSLQETAWGSGGSRGPSATDPRPPRRRTSVVISPGTGSAATSASLAEPSSSTTASTAEDDELDPWLTIGAHMSNSAFAEPSSTRPTEPQERASATTATSSTGTGMATPESDQSNESATYPAEQARRRALARQRERWRNIRVSDDRSPPLPFDPTLLRTTTASTLHALEAARADLVGPNTTTTTTTSSSTSTSNPPSASATRVRALPAGLLPNDGSYDPMNRRAQLLRTGGFGAPIGVRTAGLAISADGRTLWAASEEGIFEIRVNLKGRLFWPSLEVR